MGLENSNGNGTTPGDPVKGNDNNDVKINQKKQKQKPSHFVDPTSFQGVIWKPADYDTKDKPGKLHPAGEGEKVALLKNWREIFKQSNPALDRSARLKKTVSPKQTATTRSIAMEDINKNGREDSSDRTSGDSSLENLRDNEGTESITTPGKSTSPSVEVNGVGQDEEMADADGDTDMNRKGEGEKKAPEKSGNTVIEIPVLENMHPATSPPAKTPPKKRGRKRKADVIAEAEAEADKAGEKENEEVEKAKRPRSKKVADTGAGKEDKKSKSKSTAAPVRRSTRQKN